MQRFFFLKRMFRGECSKINNMTVFVSARNKSCLFSFHQDGRAKKAASQGNKYCLNVSIAKGLFVDESENGFICCRKFQVSAGKYPFGNVNRLFNIMNRET